MAVRRESVRLELDDGGFSTQMAKNAAATGLLERALKSLDGTSVNIHQRLSQSATQVDQLSKSASGADNSINQLTGRLRLFADAAAILGPSLAPIGAVGIAGFAGLASQMGFAAIAGGVLLGSFSGLSDALKAMNKAELEPTADNMEALRTELGALSPASAEFASQIHSQLIPALKAMRTVGRDSIIGGFGDIGDDLESLLPRLAQIMESVGGALGEITGGAVGSLASNRWGPFLSFIRDEAPPALQDMALIVGDLAHGMGELWMAFDPLNDDFSSSMVDAATSFDQWAQGLSKTDGFREFVEYVRTSGPQVADTLAAFANALVQIAQAAAPLGGPVLAALEAVAKVVGAIADSNLGTPIMTGVAALALYNRGLMAVQATQAKLGAGGLLGNLVNPKLDGAKSTLTAIKSDVASLGTTWATAGARTSREQAKMAASAKSLRSNVGTLAAEAGRTAGPIAGLAAGSGMLGDSMRNNIIEFGLYGSALGPWGAAVGASVGALSEFSNAGERSAAAISAMNNAAREGDMETLQAKIVETQRLVDDFKDTGGFGDAISDFLGGPFAPDRSNEQQEAIQRNKVALEELAGAQDRLASNTSYRDALKAQADAIMYNVEAMRTLRGETINAGNAELGYKSAVLDAKDAVEENGRVLKRNGELIDETSREAIESKGRLFDLAAAWNAQSDAAKSAPGAHRAAIRTFVDVATAMGMSAKEARDLAKSIYEIPTSHKTKIEVDVGAAKGQIASLKQQLDALKSKEIFVRVTPQGGIASSQTRLMGPQSDADFNSARGNFLDRADMHQPEIARGGPTRIWAEPETQGETYIPHANDSRRPRAKALLEATAHKFGGSVQWFARGGVVAAGSGGGTAEERLAVLQAEQRIRDILKALNKEGKDRLSKNAREIAKAELEASKAALAAAKAAVGGTTRDAREERDQQASDAERTRQEKQAADRETRERDAAARADAVLDGQERAVNSLLGAAEEQKSAAVTIRDSIQQNMDRLGDAATSGFQSGLFAKPSGNLFAAGSGSGWRNALTRDIGGLQERQGLIEQLSAAGVSGTALDALLSQGSNRDLSGLLSSGATSEFTTLFGQRESLRDVVSTQAGMAAYGQQFNAAAGEVARLGAQVLFLSQQLAAISAQRPITINEAVSAEATVRELARQQGLVVT